MNKAILTMLISMAPVIELRGGIPFGVTQGLSIGTAVFFAIIGNILPMPFLLMFTAKVFEFLKSRSEGLNNFVKRLELKAEKNKDMVEKYEFIGLMILVAIPLPGTGAWTGALVATVMELEFKKSILAIFLGVIIAAIIVTAITYGIGVMI